MAAAREKPSPLIDDGSTRPTAYAMSGPVAPHTDAAVMSERSVMRITKFQATFLVALLTAGGGLLWQHATIRALRASEAAARAQSESLATENRGLANARVNRPTGQGGIPPPIPASPLPSHSPSPNAVRPASGTPKAGHDGAEAKILAALASRGATPRDPQQLPALHDRYDDFLRNRGFTPMQIDRWIQLMMEKENVRLDLRDVMVELGIPATENLSELRRKATDRFWNEMREMLGPAGMKAFTDHESVSAYRSYLVPLTPRFAEAGAPLSSEQAEQLVRTIIANDQPRRENANDFSSTSHVDWMSVAQRAKAFLTPTQLAIVQNFAELKSVAKQ